MEVAVARSITVAALVRRGDPRQNGVCPERGRRIAVVGSELFKNNISSNRPFAAPAARYVTAGTGQPLAGAASAPSQKRLRDCRTGRRRDRICVPPSRADGESPVAMDLLRPVQIFMTRTGPKVLLRASISVAAGFFFRGAFSPLAQPVPACGLDWQSLSRPHAWPLVR